MSRLLSGLHRDHYDEKDEHCIGLLEEGSTASTDLPVTDEDAFSVCDEKPSSYSHSYLTSWLSRTSHTRNRTFTRSRFWLRIIIFLLPTWLAKRLFPAHVDQTPAKIHKTSWLDGLRGCSATSVVAYHWVNHVFLNGDVGYGASNSSSSNSLLQLPIIRVLFSGQANVTIFFVISGYALSVRPVQLMSDPTANGDKGMRSFSSSIFRRFFRLYIPAYVSTIAPLLWRSAEMPARLDLWHMMSFNRYPTYKDAVSNMQNDSEKITRSLFPRAGPSFGDSIKDWILTQFHFTTILEGSWPREKYENAYNAPLWTIPVEYRASLFLFLLQIAVFNLRPFHRISITFLMMVYSVLSDRIEMILFLGGFLIAQLDPIISEWEVCLERKPILRRYYTVSLIILFISGLWIASYPGWNPEHTPGFVWLSHCIPPTMTWKAFFVFGNGALLILFSISRLPFLQKVFTSRLTMYLGHISFSLYLIHGFLSGIVGTISLYNFARLTGNLDRHNSFLYSCAFAFSLSVIYFFVFWFADIFWRVVDKPSVKFAKWIEERLQVKS